MGTIEDQLEPLVAAGVPGAVVVAVLPAGRVETLGRHSSRSWRSLAFPRQVVIRANCSPSTPAAEEAFFDALYCM